MATYEATVKVSHITTSTKGRNGLSATDAVGAAKANLRYITRDDAAEAGNVIARTNGQFIEGTTEDLKKAARESIEKRAERHNNAYGVRLADKMVVSLPNDATIEEQRTMCSNILTNFTADSEAFGMAAIHTDKKGNKHAHFFFVDGLETKEAAVARRPDAKRVRRAEQLRMNEGGNRQEIRHRVASEINGIAKSAHRRMAEIRSFKDRGIEREPQKHEGPQVSHKLDRPTDGQQHITGRVLSRLKANAIALRKRLEGEAIPGASIRLEDVPGRYRRGWLGGAWSAWLRQTNQARTHGQDRTTDDAINDGLTAFVSDWPQQAPEASHSPTQRPRAVPPAERVRPAYLPPKEAPAPSEQEPLAPRRKRRRPDLER